MGYLSYEMGPGTLSLAKNKNFNRGPKPDISLLWVQRSIVADKLTGATYIQSIRKGDFEWISTMVQTLLCLKSTRNLQGSTDASQLALVLASPELAITMAILIGR